MSNAAAFAGFWGRNFPELTCPPVPEQLSELGLTAQMAMQSDAPELYTAMFAGKSGYRLPADVSARLESGQLVPGDADALRAAGLEVQAQQCERLRQAQSDQAMADHIAHSRAVYQQEMERTSAWQEMGVLQRMAHEPMSPQQIAANRRRYGISE
jgi:hypothetical protein